jgi:hypothetical protein
MNVTIYTHLQRTSLRARKFRAMVLFVPLNQSSVNVVKLEL